MEVSYPQVYWPEKDTGLYRKRPWTGQHTILEPMLYWQPQYVFLYQADNFPAGRNEHRRMPPVTRDSQGLHIFHRASISPHSQRHRCRKSCGRSEVLSVMDSFIYKKLYQRGESTSPLFFSLWMAPGPLHQPDVEVSS